MRLVSDRQLHLIDSFFPLENLERDPKLAQIALVLERRPDLLRAVQRDLSHGLARPRGGRRGVTAEQALRFAILQKLYDCSYRDLRARLADSLYLRHFAGFGWHPIPSHQAIHQAIKKVSPKTTETLNQLVIDAAQELGLEDGTRAISDTTVVESHIHPPTDSGLLYDCVQALSRRVGRLGQLDGRLTQSFVNHTRQAKRLMLQINQGAARHGAKAQETRNRLYQELVDLTRGVVESSRAITGQAQAQTYPNPKLARRIAARVLRIQEIADLAPRVIEQTCQRVFEDQTVPASQKLYSIFEPHTDLICRGKTSKPCEYGHKVRLNQGASGLVSDYEVLEGNPADCQQLEAALDSHERIFGQTAEIFAADRGYYSQAGIDQCKSRGVRVVSIPATGRVSPERRRHERGKRFQQAQRRRAGIEACISALKRGRGMSRCNWRGRTSFQVFVGLAILAHNLLLIANHLLG